MVAGRFSVKGGVWVQNSGELQLQLRRAEGTAAIVTRKKAIQ